jgi:hypothetical protein
MIKPPSSSENILPAYFIEDSADNIASSTKSKDEFSPFFLDADFILDIETIKASAKERGDKKSEAFAIASLSFYRFIKNRNAVVDAIKDWIGLIDSNEVKKNFSFIRQNNENFASLLHSESKWRSLKQGPESVRKFAEERANLAERMKAIIPKEASAWATSPIGSEKLNAYLPHILRMHDLNLLAAEISDGRFFILPALAMKIEQMENMELWTTDNVIHTLFEIKEIRSILTSELFRVKYSMYLITALSFWMFINKHDYIDHELMNNDSPSELAQDNDCDLEECMHDRRITDGADKDWMASMIGSAIWESKAWGNFGTYVKTLSDIDINLRYCLQPEILSANAVIWSAGQELIEEHRLKEVALKDARKNKKQAEIDMEHSKAQIANLNRQVNEMRKARTKPGSKPSPVDTSPFEEELRLTRKANEQIRDELGKKETELKQVYELLDSVLSSQREDRGQVSVKLSTAELIKKRGVIIGGHYTLTEKLRKELTDCLFYAPDAKLLDDDAVKNREYILFITGYVNHCLTGHALRLSRLYNIPCGYTTRTNVPLVLEDIAEIFVGVKT